MGTYYLAQLGISLSVVNSHKGIVHVFPDESDPDYEGAEEEGPYGRRNRGRNVSWQKSLPPSSVQPFDSDDEEDMTPFPRKQPY
jgi:hypothetical protein